MLQSAIVTGASSGIGRAACAMLAKSGYLVFGLARSYDKLQALAAELPAESYVPVEFDATRPETFDAVTGSIATKGEIFALVNNAGYVEPGAIEDVSMTDLRAQFETNFFGAVGLTKAVLPAMMQKGRGRIVNVSSMAGMISLPLIGAYCAAKHALDAVSSPDPKPRYVIGSGREKAGVRLRPFVSDRLFYSQVAKRLLT